MCKVQYIASCEAMSMLHCVKPCLCISSRRAAAYPEVQSQFQAGKAVLLRLL